MEYISFVFSAVFDYIKAVEMNMSQIFFLIWQICNLTPTILFYFILDIFKTYRKVAYTYYKEPLVPDSLRVNSGITFHYPWII